MKFTPKVLAMAVATGLALPAATYATNGMFMIGYGTKSRGMGGVAIATTLDSLAGAANPAAVRAFNTRMDVGMDVFLPTAEASLGLGTANEITQSSRANIFLIPNMGGAMKFNRKISFGFTAVGAGGGGSRYNENLFNKQNNVSTAETLGVNMMVMQMAPTVAFRASKNHSIGASLVIGIQTFRAFGLSQFAQFTKDQQPLYARGNDWAYGAGVRLGWLGHFAKKKLSVGAVATSKVYNTKFEKYQDLFAEEGGFDTPPNVGLGVAWRPNKQWTIGLDITRTFYSEVASVSNAGPNLPGDPDGPFPNGDRNTYALGYDEGLGFGWSDQTVYKIGVNYDYNKQWSFRTGWNYGKSPIDEQYDILFNTLAPAVTQNHFTIGTSYRPSKMVEISASYVHAFEYKQRGPTYIGVQGEISMYQNSFGISWAMQF